MTVCDKAEVDDVRVPHTLSPKTGRGLGAQLPPDYCLDLCKHPLSTREEALPGRRQLAFQSGQMSAHTAEGG